MEPPEGRPSARLAARRRRALWLTAAGAALLHTLAVAWVWGTWTVGLRGGWLVWMDLPISLLYLQARDGLLLVLSLVLGGLQWAVAGGLLSALLAAVARRK